MKRIQQYTLALSVLIVLASVGVQPALADHNDSFVDGLVDEGADSPTATFARWMAERSGQLARNYAALTADTEGETAEEYATDLKEEFNSERGDLTPYANERLDASTDRDVFRLCTSDQEGGSDVVYLVSNVSNGSWTDERMVSADTFATLNRTVDYTVAMDWYASRNADEELDTFVEKFAEDGTNASATYRAKMLAKYGGSIESDLWGDDVEGCPT